MAGRNQLLRAVVHTEVPENIKIDPEFYLWWDQEAKGIAEFVKGEAEQSTAFWDKTGKLRSSFDIRKKRDGKDDVWIVRNKAPHAHLIENGHAQVSPDGKRLGHVPAHPYLRPAADKGIQEAIARFRAK
jgi:hypothetical protein